jgi:ABC-type antimicrobial peptide transport system permease subunit
VLQHFSWPVALGLLLGTGFAAVGSQLLRKVLYGVSNLDLASYTGALCVLTTIIALSMLLPARRTLRLDLAKILRYD